MGWNYDIFLYNKIMDYVNYFEPILDKDEKILETFRPNKKRFVGLTILRSTITTLVILLFPTIFILVALFAKNSAGQCDINGVPASPEECSGALSNFVIIPCIIAGVIVLGYLFSIITRIVVYRKTYYCCTNKRIIIRRGFIGADFQTLDYDLIGGMDVQVDLFDKLVHPNTGTISFASAASPMIQKVSSYYFAHVENPYEAYKKIKEISSANRDGKLNS